MLAVFCADWELEEDGEIIAVGDRMRRAAIRRHTAYFGSELDDVEWSFNRDSEGDRSGCTTIAGEVVRIEAIYVRMTRGADGWTAIHGSAHAEALHTTAATRRIEPQIECGPLSLPDEDGHSYRAGYPLIHEGDEKLAGWLLHLDDEVFELHSA
jgi:hypothetical protein